MKYRKRKKVSECSHRYQDSFMVTDDPYPMYMDEDYCKKGYNEQFMELWEKEGMEPICEKCKAFTASRPCIIKERERRQFIKETEQYYKKLDRKMYKDGTLHLQQSSQDRLNDLNSLFNECPF